MCQRKCVSRWPHVEGRSNVNKEKLNKGELVMFTASNGWLKSLNKHAEYVRRGLLVK